MNKEMPGAVVMNGHFQGLGVVRSLSKMGIPVCLLENSLSITRFSKAKKYLYRTPSTLKESEYIFFLMKLAEQKGFQGWIIFPNSDEDLILLSKHRDELEPYFKIPTPRWETLKHCLLKKLTYKVAENLEIPIPKTACISDVKALETLNISYPIVLKPSVKLNFYKATKKKALLAQDKEDLIRKFNILEYYNFEKERPAIEFVKEKITNIEFLADEGIIKLSVETYSPETSKNILEFYINNLNKLNQEFKLTTESPLLKIISPPFLPEKKSFPKTKINMAIAGLGGLICGLLFIYFKERTTNIR